MMRFAYSSETAQAIAAGDTDALLRGLVAHAALWFEAAGSNIGMRHLVGPMTCVLQTAPKDQVLLAAACSLCATLELSPQGREAIANFGLQRRNVPPMPQPACTRAVP